MVRMKRRSTLVTLAFLMFMGIAVYFRLWAIDYNISLDDSDMLRRQFDIANREAMDESAEWRQKYDWEVDRANKCVKELQVFQESSRKAENASGINHKFAVMQKENAILLERVETLKRELEEEKLKCKSRYMN
ncbi:unnamed protein product [Lathyrus oleraceus]|uniref:Uncharacterized protein n=1 Tax=Pisum sativum TaxID=3888 RepID=A0A9D5A7N2_PEA|nr:uncharacterized protein LOC127098206 [Pisum sativum]KAI5395585.1 hypothetical protein KIW84_061947 [Pisum sativum]